MADGIPVLTGQCCELIQ